MNLVPSLTKNQRGARASKMHQSKKGKQWYFGMKAHASVDVHSVRAGHVADVPQAQALLHGGESAAFGDEDARQEWLEQTKARIRAKVEHPFRIIKCLFGHRKMRYRGILKNTAQRFTLLGLSNLLLVRRYPLMPRD